MNKFAYSFDNNTFYRGASTQQETLAEAMKECPANKNTVYIGQIKEWEPRVSALDIIEQLQDDACEKCDDFATDYLQQVTEEQYDKLSDVLTAGFLDWAKKYGYYPCDFFSVDNVSNYELGNDC